MKMAKNSPLYVFSRNIRTVIVPVKVNHENELRKIERRLERYGFISSYMRIQDYDEKGRPHVIGACYAVRVKDADFCDLKRMVTQLKNYGYNINLIE